MAGLGTIPHPRVEEQGFWSLFFPVLGSVLRNDPDELRNQGIDPKQAERLIRMHFGEEGFGADNAYGTFNEPVLPVGDEFREAPDPATQVGIFDKGGLFGEIFGEKNPNVVTPNPDGSQITGEAQSVSLQPIRNLPALEPGVGITSDPDPGTAQFRREQISGSQVVTSESVGPGDADEQYAEAQRKAAELEALRRQRFGNGQNFNFRGSNLGSRSLGQTFSNFGGGGGGHNIGGFGGGNVGIR